MAEQGRFRCGRCGFATDWFEEWESGAGAEEIHHHSVAEHPEEVAKIQSMPPLERLRSIQELERHEVRGRPSGGGSGCLMLMLTMVGSFIAALGVFLAAW
ncbi:hypothetical protein ACGF8B_25110 [Streptomyces sp. NPDC047917]|uniref:hypothetical protein n=1 Tax=Streptomyces sp. NPDC047917 TaxID=3365491 RepID=UPI0037120BEB